MNVKSTDSLANLRAKLKKSSSRKPRKILVCAGGGCLASGADEIRTALESALDAARGADGEDGALGKVELKSTGCMGPCAEGPVVVVEPDGVFYQGVRPEDAKEIVESHIVAGNPVKRLFHRDVSEEQAAADHRDAIEFFSRQQKVVLRNCGNIDPTSIDDYIAAGGYQSLATILAANDPAAVIKGVKTSGLRGRGGAGFPTWLKWDATRIAEGTPKYVLCNADEGDPGAFMDRSLLEGDPHSVIEGMAIAAFAIGASAGYVYVRAEYPLAVARLDNAIKQATEYGLLGDDIMGTGFSFTLGYRKGSGAFVCGEETALIHSIEGKRGEPRPRPPFPAQKGLWGQPTLLNNVETYANVPAVFSLGPATYEKSGTEDSPGTKVFALAGSIRNAGLVEVPIGTTLGEVIYDIGGGIKNDKPFKAAQIGGPSGGCIPKEHLNVPLDYASLNELGAIMGSGGLIVMDDDACMVDVARFFLEFVQEESCGKCTSCRVGTKRMLEILDRICEGRGEMEDIDRLERLGRSIKDTALCGLGQTAPNPVLSTLRHFRHEYVEHIRDRHCSAGVCPSLVRAPCQSACPAGVDVPGFVSLVKEKRYAEALRLHRERNPFAAVCARVCFHTCEEKCRRSSLDSPVAIRAVKRFMVDQEIVVQTPEVREDPANADRKVAIIGAGPAGLSCGYFLARLGYRPEVFEAQPRPGGMLVQAIPEYRLPRETLAREIRMIEQLGVTIHPEKRLGRDFTLKQLQDDGYDAVFLGPGSPACVDLDIPGSAGDGVVRAGDFLREYNVRGSAPVGDRVVVVGGGNAAIDAARTAIRLGAEVTVVYRRTRDQMPAYAEEIEEAVAEGVDLRTLTQPVGIERDENGAVTGMQCAELTLGDFDRSGRRRPTRRGKEIIEIPADQVIVAIGQKLDAAPLIADVGVAVSRDGFIRADHQTGQTSVPWIFSGGDAVLGPASVVEAIGAGERAAVGIDLYLTGENHAFWREDKPVDVAFDPDADPVPFEREALETIPVERRRHNFSEVEKSWSEVVALRQASRCLRCDFGKCLEARTVEKEAARG